MAGLRMIAKMYGGVVLNGVTMIYDEVRGDFYTEEEMTPERKMASEKKKWERIKRKIDEANAKDNQKELF
jgi:hypothetical protein